MIQIKSALVEMQKNVDELQKNMGTIKQAKDQCLRWPRRAGMPSKKRVNP
jgi:hypothetical protein